MPVNLHSVGGRGLEPPASDRRLHKYWQTKEVLDSDVEEFHSYTFLTSLANFSFSMQAWTLALSFLDKGSCREVYSSS
jgi:hypothetical protein